MAMQFSVRVYKGERYFVARVPGLGITTQGATKDEARRNLREAIQTHLEAMADYAMEHGKVAIEKGQLVPAE
ncbi:MAG: type II toxin-antitoxin system HicB family antitoxin [Nitrososphaerota archaeon]|jgi:predicted RNase H-like HicB family nuclease|nr:type II toxin-antitoxin system HicB family antitoxin [Nitrososphaerota archaeon]MDG6911658.1 type II toxin-antitoxin system HicB family antitoxin [Nitrososphaerota archaeon]MDG6940560.1 type II toxin-antitoxin system HicB family antitoxin [Nitrososphaerota archaeon]MDG6963256.1 type II toxin-antitoxin system HicB family antitoxin [Nitrososphaerota archaeon]MDG6969738.1 type II toxin-antitoxin system HicB family antitoxin [Nitrososphaerota archaeon]